MSTNYLHSVKLSPKNIKSGGTTTATILYDASRNGLSIQVSTGVGFTVSPTKIPTTAGSKNSVDQDLCVRRGSDAQSNNCVLVFRLVSDLEAEHLTVRK